jgi:hypothetical protein
VPFRWTLRENVEGNATEGEMGVAERLQLGWAPDREPFEHFDGDGVRAGVRGASAVLTRTALRRG